MGGVLLAMISHKQLDLFTSIDYNRIMTSIGEISVSPAHHFNSLHFYFEQVLCSKYFYDFLLGLQLGTRVNILLYLNFGVQDISQHGYCLVLQCLHGCFLLPVS